MKNVMIDLETLGVTADAVIMSIGAVQFEMDGAVGSRFYASISIDSNLAVGRKIDEQSLIWWMTQDAAARKVFEEPKTSIEAALFDLSEWFPEEALVWSNGASFDIPMLEHAYSALDLESPWKFYNARCMRTYKKLPGANGCDWIEPKVAHNALDDAMAQTLTLQAIHAHLFGDKVPA